jgi:hypothetical protein
LDTSGARISSAVKKQIENWLEEQKNTRAVCIRNIVRHLLDNKEGRVEDLRPLHRKGTTDESIARNMSRVQGALGDIPVAIYRGDKGKVFWFEEIPSTKKQ